MPTCEHRKNNSREARIRFLANSFIITLIAAAMLFLTSANQVRSLAAAEADDFSIWLDGPTEAAPDETIFYEIITDASGLYGAQLEIIFDPAVLQVLDADENTDGVQIHSGDCPVPDFIVTNTVDNDAGKISYAASSLNPTQPCDGGTVASFQFQVAGTAPEGGTLVQFEKALLADINGGEILATTVDLNIEIREGYFIYLPAIFGNYP
jgi:hypothetical protein